MQNTSLAAQAVANGPMSAAPPSFDGHGWLLVLNLALMTTTALVAAMVVVKIVGDGLRQRRPSLDEAPLPGGPLVTLLRWLALIAFGGMMLRTGVEAVTLWGWNPAEPTQTGWYLTLKRFVDPFGATAYLAAMCLYIMTEDTMIGSLARRPFPDRLTRSLPKLKNPAILAAMSVVVAVLVVSLR